MLCCEAIRGDRWAPDPGLDAARRGPRPQPSLPTHQLADPSPNLHLDPHSGYHRRPSLSPPLSDEVTRNMVVFANRLTHLIDSEGCVGGVPRSVRADVRGHAAPRTDPRHHRDLHHPPARGARPVSMAPADINIILPADVLIVPLPQNLSAPTWRPTPLIDNYPRSLPPTLSPRQAPTRPRTRTTSSSSATIASSLSVCRRLNGLRNISILFRFVTHSTCWKFEVAAHSSIFQLTNQSFLHHWRGE